MAILIVEGDLGFVFWLGRALDYAGHSSLPAKDVQDASSLLRDLNPDVALIIVNPRLSGAAALVQQMRGATPDIKVIELTENAREPGWRLPFADTCKSKPRVADEAAAREWIAAVETILAGDAVGI
jgi:CheY-like chemotaxis protein